MNGLVDLQVNGYAGVDFNADAVTTADIVAACERLEADGVGSILATIITAPLDTMRARVQRLVQATLESTVAGRVIRGIHVEGPFLSDKPGYVGTHPADATRPATPSDAERLCEAAEGLVRIVTLAPERDQGFATTRWLADRGIVVSAGHCDPAIDQLRAAIDQGLTMFTHLGNGCPLEMHRHDNVIQRVLSLDTLWVCFIGDGVHVPFFALNNYLSRVGLDRAILVSDAISAAGQGPGRFTLAGQHVVVTEDLATWSLDRQHLMGSACPLPVAVQNLIAHCGLTAAEAQQLAATNPLRAIGR